MALPARGVAAADPTILAVTYASPDANIHIGSSVTMYMTAMIATQSLNLSVTSGSNASSINLAGTDLLSIVVPQVLYVTDGQRVWAVPFAAGGLTNFSFGDGELIANAAPFNLGATYTTIANQSFRVYTGSLITGVTPGINTFTIEVGARDSLGLGDSGFGGDGNAFDGIWTAVYTVPDLGYIISGAHLFGNVLYGSTPAVNMPFQSPLSISMDTLRPSVETWKFSTNRANYNGVLYLSALSQGTSTPDPTNAQGRFDVSVNKKDTVVDIVIESASNKSLPPLVFPSNAASQNGWRVWDGRRGDGTFIADGTYAVKIYVRDINGVVGQTRTTEVNVVSLRFDVGNIRLTPSSLNAQPPIANGVLTTIRSDVRIFNDSGSSLRSSLNVLGWGNPANFADHADTRSTVWSLQKVDFLDTAGASKFKVSGVDGSPGYDNDIDYLVSFAASPNINPPDCYGTGSVYPGSLGGVSQTVDVGDGNIENDYTSAVFQELTLTGGTLASPTQLSAAWGVQVYGNTPSDGAYRLQLRSILNGLEYVKTTPPLSPDIPDACSGGSATPIYYGQKTHFYPSSEPSGNPSSNRGLGIFVEDSSVIFSVSPSNPPTLDSTPPYLLTSNPQDSSLVSPNTYSSTARLSAQLKDDESSMNTSGTVTFIRVKDPTGGYLQGSSSTNGGAPGNQITVYFAPNVPITTGGIYSMEVNACNSGGLCIQKLVPFTVQDQTAPSIAAVALVPQTGADIPLSIAQTGPEGPFENIEEILVTLGMPGTSQNTIDWDASNVSLYRTDSGTRVPVPMTRLTTGTPSTGQIRYRLNSVINYAGSFETETQTFSKDASSQSFSGPPAGTIQPRFFTNFCSACVTVLYSNNPSTARPALSSPNYVSITSGGLPVSTALLQAFLPTFSSLPADPSYVRLNPTASLSQAVQFSVGSGPLLTPLTFTYSGSLNIKLYYDDADFLGTGVVETDLRVRGYNGSSWSDVSALQDSVGSTGNSFTITPISGAAAYSIYAIAYPASTTTVAGVATPTALAFKATRSFNPSHANPIYRKARFYYTETLPKEVEVRIFDTAGTLVRALSLNSGVKLGDTLNDPSSLRTSYFFEWDGRNDNGDNVKNGLYLVRWRVQNVDGSSDTQVKSVALIK